MDECAEPAEATMSVRGLAAISRALALNAGVPAILPPSITSVVPVTNDDCCDDSQTTASATSDGSPMRRIGIASAAMRWYFSPARSRWWVRIGPGATALTRMPRSA